MDGRFILNGEQERQKWMRWSFNDARGEIWGLAAARLVTVDQMKFILGSSRQGSEHARSQVIPLSFSVEELLMVEGIILGGVCSQMV